MADSVTQLPEGFILDKIPALAVVPDFAGETSLPPGFVLDAPEDQVQFLAPDIGIDEVVDAEDDMGFVERFSEDLENRKQLAIEIQNIFQRGEQTFGESVLQLTGKVGAGSILDFLGEVVISGIEGLSAITPDEIEDPIVETATKAAHLFLETDLGKAGLSAANKGLEVWNEFRAENPRAARNIESVVDIALLVAPVKSKPKIKSQPTIVGRAAERVAAAGETQSARQLSDFVDDLILPKQTAAVRTEQAGRVTEQGILRTREVGLSARERVIADQVSKVPGVSPSKTLQGNRIAISDEITKEAATLKSQLRKNDIIFPRKEFSAELDRALERLKENPLIVGDALTSGEKVVDAMRRIVADKPSTGSGLLQARKELDAFISRQRPKVFDPAQESALSTAVREIRTSTNDFIDQRAVNVGVKDSLKKQSNLFRALDNIDPKAAVEAQNAILRAWQSANKVLGLRNEFNQVLATAFGLGGLGAAATFAPFFTKLVLSGVVVYSGTKAILSPGAKKGMSKLLAATDKAIRTSKDEALVSQLRLDRAAILELLKQTNENE